MSAPLESIRVLDFTHILAGPYCTQLLADAGAQIFKVEPPGGEFARVRGPRRVGPDGESMSSYHAAINRGKQSIVIDLKRPDGLELAKRLAADVDVVIENFAPGALARLGLDLADLRDRNPRLVTASISLFGSDAPASTASRGGLAIVAEGESTFTAMTRDASGTPVRLRVPLGDMATGLSAYAGIVTALYERESTGRGRHLDVSMVQTLLSLNAIGITAAQIPVPESAHVSSLAGYGIFPTADGFVTIGVNSDAFFEKLAVAMGKPELAEDPRYVSFEARDPRASEVDEIIIAWTLTLDSESVIERIGGAGVPCGRIATPEDLLGDPSMRALGLIEEVDDGLGGTIDTPANPMGFRADGPVGIPRIGEHARSVLAAFGIDDLEYARLQVAGALGPQPAPSHS
jgi:CoA:oxalate CoA-transferase